MTRYRAARSEWDRLRGQQPARKSSGRPWPLIVKTRAERLPQIAGRLSISGDSTMSSFPSRPQDDGGKPRPAGSRRILVVDDEAHIVQVLSLKLRNAGYEVITAVDGEEGIEQAINHRPHLIINDFHMPY